jgi:hypothetical protein
LPQQRIRLSQTGHFATTGGNSAPFLSHGWPSESLFFLVLDKDTSLFHPGSQSVGSGKQIAYGLAETPCLDGQYRIASRG